MSSVDRLRARARAASATQVGFAMWAALAVPFVVALLVLRSRGWFPVLDLAMTELRVRDVGGSHTPLIGLPGRIGLFPEQGSHPGPLSFYLLAPAYRLFGSSAWALEVAMALIALVAIGAALWIAKRRGGVRTVLVVAALLAVLARGYGMDVLTQPWNPYLPLLVWVVVLLATWAVVDGDHRLLVVVGATGSLAAQTHLPYLGLSLGMGALAAACVAHRWWRVPGERGPIGRSAAVAVVVSVVCWIPVVIDQNRRTPGNLSMLRDYFGDPPERPVGQVEGLRLMLRHLDVIRLIRGVFGGDGYFLRAGFRLDRSIVPGVVVVLLWVGSVAVARRLRDHRLMALQIVIAWLLVLSVVSMSRIFGKVWFYLTLWAWTTTVLVVVAIVWAGWLLVEHHRAGWRDRSGRVLVGCMVVIGAGSWAALTVEATTSQPPEAHLSDILGDLVAPTIVALRTGVGAATDDDATYLVTWDDALHFGSQGYGLVNELERRGIDVGVYATWRVPVTPHRVLTAEEAVAEIHLATGSYVGQWRADPTAVEVIAVEPRTSAELAEYGEVEAELIDGLRRLDLDDLVAMLDTNLFGVQLDPRVPTSLQARVDRLLVLGQPTAVFILPAGTTS